MPTVDRVVVELEARLQNFDQQVNAAGQRFDQTMTRVQTSAAAAERQVTASAAGIKQALMATAAAIGVAFSVDEIRGIIDSYTTLSNALHVAGLSGAEFSRTQADLFAIANRNGAEVETLARLYQRLSIAGNDLGASHEDMRAFVTTAAAAIRAQGINSEQARGPLLQLAQAMGTGKVRAEEFNSVLEGLPIILQAAARHMEGFDGNVQKLRLAVINGTVDSKTLFKAIVDGSAEVQGTADRAVLTLANSFQVLKNQLVLYVGGAAATSGASGALSQGIQGLAQNVDVLVPALGVLAGLFAGRFVGGMAAATVAKNGLISRTAAYLTQGVQEAQVNRETANSMLIKARAEQDAAAASVNAERAVVEGLRQEREAYAQNLLAIERQVDAERAAQAARAQIVAAQLALQREALAVQAANARAGFGNVVVGAGALSRPVSETAAHAGNEAAAEATAQKVAQAEAEASTKGLIVTRQALARVDVELAAAEKVLGAAQSSNVNALMGVRNGQLAYQAALVRTTALSQVASVATQAFSGALSFFGGPIGLAILAVVAAISAVSAESERMAQAGQQAASILDELKQKADAAGEGHGTLRVRVDEVTKASYEVATGAREARDAYNEMAQAADIASRAIANLSATEREEYRQKVKKALDNVDDAIDNTGLGGAFTTDQTERINNARQKVLDKFGYPTLTGGFQGQSEAQIQDAYAQARAGKATKDQIAALTDYNRQVSIGADLQQKRNRLLGTLNELDAPYKPRADQPAKPQDNTLEVTGSAKLGIAQMEEEVRIAQARGDQRAAIEAEYYVNIAKERNKNASLGMAKEAANDAAVDYAGKLRAAQLHKLAETEGRHADTAARRAQTQEREAEGTQRRVDQEVLRANLDMLTAQQGQADAVAAQLENALQDNAHSRDVSAADRAANNKELASALGLADAEDARLDIELQRIELARRAAVEQASNDSRLSEVQKEALIGVLNESARLQGVTAREADKTLTEQNASAGANIGYDADKAGLTARASNQGLSASDRLAAQAEILSRERDEQDAQNEITLAKRGISDEVRTRARTATVQSREDKAEADVSNTLADLHKAQLDSMQGMATTARDRLRIELEILEEQQTQRRLQAEITLAALDQSRASNELRARVRGQLDTLEATEREGARRQNLSPLEQYSQDTPRTGNERAEAYEKVLVNSLDNANSALVKFSLGAESAGDAAKEFGRGLVQDVLNQIYRQMLAPVADFLSSKVTALFGDGAATLTKTSADTAAAAGATALATSASSAAIAVAALAQSAAAAAASSGGGAVGQAGSLFASAIAQAPAFAEGGSGIVGGSGGVDSKLFMAKVSPGEHFEFTPPNRMRARSQVARTDLTVHYTIDLNGANGDETIRQIAREESAQGAAYGIKVAHDASPGWQQAFNIHKR